MTDRQALIAATLAEWRTTPFAWGAADCVMSLCDYGQALCGTDPGLAFRGRYATGAAANEIIARHGGFVPLLDAMFGLAGFARVAEPIRGDVVAVRMFAHEGAALWLGPRVAMKTEGRGLLEVRAEYVTVQGAWRWEG